jgi:hypothetical protein
MADRSDRPESPEQGPLSTASTAVPAVRSRRRRRLWILGVLLVIGIAALIWWLRRMEQLVLDAYRADFVEAELIAFLQDHDDRLPADDREWRDYLDSRSAMTPPYYTHDECQRQFRIDFQFPLQSVDWNLPWDSQQDRFQILQPRPGRTSRWAGPDVNQRIDEYLRGKRAESLAPLSARDGTPEMHARIVHRYSL